MIVRSFYNARTHEVQHVVTTNARTYDGCLFTGLAEMIVRTRCDQFLTNDDVPIVVREELDAPSCAECRERARIAAVGAAAHAG